MESTSSPPFEIARDCRLTISSSISNKFPPSLKKSHLETEIETIFDHLKLEKVKRNELLLQKQRQIAADLLVKQQKLKHELSLKHKSSSLSHTNTNNNTNETSLPIKTPIHSSAMTIRPCLAKVIIVTYPLLIICVLDVYYAMLCVYRLKQWFCRCRLI